jgi:DoxX-like family
LMRALAALPFDMPRRQRAVSFAAVAVDDVAQTVVRVAARWRGGERNWRVHWDVMEDAPGTLGDVVDTFRAHFRGPRPRLPLPRPLMTLGALAGDAAGLLGWRPPLRSTAVAELCRGVAGNPANWMHDTGITPRSAAGALALIPASVQERWFGRLYLFKALAVVSLVIFWCLSGVIGLTAGFEGARAILLAHGFGFSQAHYLTIISSVLDIGVGLAIAWQPANRFGLIAGIGVSLGYMALAAILAPDLWIEPLGALVKTGPAIVLMLFCLAVADDR